MNLYGILMLILWELVLPVVAGSIFISVWRPVVKGPAGPFVVSWISGQFLLFGLFQVLAVPFVVKQKKMTDLLPFYGAAVALILVLALGRFVMSLIRQRGKDKPQRFAGKISRKTGILWGIFALFLLVQLVMTVFMTYGDGDDAFYVALSAAASSGRGLFGVSPYTGLATGMDFRYGLAAFPMWIGMLSYLSGVSAAIVAHVSFALEMILLAYGVLGLLGSLLLRERSDMLPVFLVGGAILILFGDVSNMVPENFLLARSRQGKAALATFVIPMLVVMLYLLMEKLQEKGAFCFLHWVLLESVILTACLCSTLGGVLCCLLVACAGLCGAVMMRRMWHLFLLALCCVPCLIYGGLYLMMK